MLDREDDFDPTDETHVGRRREPSTRGYIGDPTEPAHKQFAAEMEKFEAAWRRRHG